jgi:Cu/Ag efflux protein CusF
MNRAILKYLAFITVVCAGTVMASAQKPVEQSGNVSKTAAIMAIDHTTRVVTLKDAKGNVEEFQCGPEIKRFDELKVGDSVTFSYHAAVVYQIAKPGDKGATATGTSEVVRGQGVKPSGAITQQMKVTVTVVAIDAAVPSITVKMPNGHVMSAAVQDKTSLQGVKVGDKVDVTYTGALMITVEPPKK